MDAVAAKYERDRIFVGDFKMKMLLLLFVAVCSLSGLANQEMESIKQIIRQLEPYAQSIQGQSPEETEKIRAKLETLRQLESVMGSEKLFMAKILNGQISDYREFAKSIAAKVMLTDDEMRALKEYIRRLESVKSFSEMCNLPEPISSMGAVSSANHPMVVDGFPGMIRRGDMIFRAGNGIGSDVFYRASTREKRFTHVGIVVSDGEAARMIDFSAQDVEWHIKAMRVPVCEIMDDASDLAVYRYIGPDADKVREQIAWAAEKRIGIPFDPAFDLKTKDRLYCTEMVRDCVNEAAGHEVIGVSRKGDFEYVAIDDCYRNEMIKVWDCRDAKPVEVKSAVADKLSAKPQSSLGSAARTSTTNAPFRRIIRFVPKNGGRR